MPDVRQTTVPLEDFRSLAVENPISVGGRWARTDAVWASGLRVRHPDLVLGTANPTYGSSYFTPEHWDGDDAEAWGYATGGNASGLHWSIGLVQQPGGSSAIDGYEGRIGTTSGGVFYDIWKISNGSYSLQAHASGVSLAYGDAHWQMFRRNGSAVELWASDDSGPAGTPTNWFLIGSITDTTYQTGLYAYLSMADNSGSYIHGWETFGAGPRKELWRPQVYRRQFGVA